MGRGRRRWRARRGLVCKQAEVMPVREDMKEERRVSKCFEAVCLGPDARRFAVRECTEQKSGRVADRPDLTPEDGTRQRQRGDVEEGGTRSSQGRGACDGMEPLRVVRWGCCQRSLQRCERHRKRGRDWRGREGGGATAHARDSTVVSTACEEWEVRVACGRSPGHIGGCRVGGAAKEQWGVGAAVRARVEVVAHAPGEGGGGEGSGDGGSGEGGGAPASVPAVEAQAHGAVGFEGMGGGDASDKGRAGRCWCGRGALMRGGAPVRRATDLEVENAEAGSCQGLAWG